MSEQRSRGQRNNSTKGQTASVEKEDGEWRQYRKVKTLGAAGVSSGLKANF